MPVESMICQNLKLLVATFQIQVTRSIFQAFNGPITFNIQVSYTNFMINSPQRVYSEDPKSLPISTDNIFQIWLWLFQLTGAPATSPGSTGSGSNLSPSCGESSAASAHNPAPSPLSSHRSLPGNVPEAMGGQQVTQQLLCINISFESVSKWQNCSGPTTAGQLLSRPLLLLPKAPSALLHDAGACHRLTVPWWFQNTQ